MASVWAGFATAIIAGGPGVVFRMRLAGVFGIATKYCEVYSSVKYRVKDRKGEIESESLGNNSERFDSANLKAR